jgi:hypothetical protein
MNVILSTPLTNMSSPQLRSGEGVGDNIPFFAVVVDRILLSLSTQWLCITHKFGRVKRGDRIEEKRERVNKW